MRSQLLWVAGKYLILAYIVNGPALAQISTDGTLPTHVRQSGEVFEITGGKQVGSNLFHSFAEFSVPTSGTAHFNSAISVRNIISRVTGRSVSDIDGIIRADGSVNLFLINPNGIVFGPNAQLDIGGSFLGSTASGIKFADGTFFNATAPLNPQLLTVSVPIGLQFGNKVGSIVNQSQASPGGATN